MEEKNKNIIYSIIAIIIGLIIGGCTQVKAATITAFNDLQVYVNGNKNYTYLLPNYDFTLTIDNATYMGTNNTQNWNNQLDTLEQDKVLAIRFCAVSYGEGQITLVSNQETGYGKPKNTKLYQTTTTCSHIQAGTGNILNGYEMELQYEIGIGNGVYAYIDLDNGMNQIQLYLSTILKSPESGGVIEKIRYTFQQYIRAPEDLKATAGASVENQLEEIINGGKFDKPSRDEVLSDYEDKEEELWEIIGVPNYNDLNIDIDANTNSKIWNLIVYILQQNTAILTMVITILSISILKLILNR